MKDFKPHIGKSVIEILTLGMYEDARFIYREYVQNAADQIDVAVEEKILNKKSDGKINIIIDKTQKSISITDNATGIASKNVLQFLGDVANSQKDMSIRKGFRGIGRLGGLGYCEKLVFETSYKEETKKSIITLDAKQLKKIIEDRADTRDAAGVISVITTLEKTECEVGVHFFKVSLYDVTNEELLDEDNVRRYLSMVAPIPFDPDFPFSSKIRDYFQQNNVKIEEYNVELNVNERKLHKAYKSEIYDKNRNPISEILDIDFFEFRDEEGDLITLGWYDVSDLLNKIIHPVNIERGLRIRKDNIQIGSEDTLNRFFREDRFNHHFVGEIHVLGTAFIPNARRDYFNDNKTVQLFETRLRELSKNLYRLAHDSSSIHSRAKEIQLYKKEKKKFDKKKFRNKEEEKKYYESNLSEPERKAQMAMKTLEKIESKAKSEKPVKIIFDHIVSQADLSIEVDNDNEKEERVYHKPSFTKLSEQEKKLVLEIFTIIENNLSFNEAQKLKQKIIEHYN